MISRCLLAGDMGEHSIVWPLPDWAPLEAGQVLRLSGYDVELR